MIYTSDAVFPTMFDNFVFCLFLLMYSLLQDLSCFSSCRYQPPLPADQVKPLNEYEEEGGELIVLSLIFLKE